MKIRSYRELSQLETFEERFNYIKLKGVVGESTFGYSGFLNQVLYKSKEWLAARDVVIIRDNGCDLGIEDYLIKDSIIVHHMNPITIEDVEEHRAIVFDPNYLITTADRTHNAIHFGDISQAVHEPVVTRRENDTRLW